MSYFLIKRIYYRRNLKKFGDSSIIDRPLRIKGHGYISLGNNVLIKYKTSLSAVSIDPDTVPELEFGDGTIIGNFNHIYSTRKVVIGKKVLTADKVYISDNQHDYTDPYTPIMDQAIKQLNDVQIGDGTWIGENVCILGSSVGENCVIGANSVVTNSIPDYCVAIGAPARIIKRYNELTKKWEKIVKSK